jgi:lipopolysaccharide/colanic/teichoic acid biosynthesis glycosyltransferase
VAIKLEDNGPIFYRQERWGLGGSRFYRFLLKALLGNYFNEDSIRTLRYPFYAGRYLRKRKVNSG